MDTKVSCGAPRDRYVARGLSGLTGVGRRAAMWAILVWAILVLSLATTALLPTPAQAATQTFPIAIGDTVAPDMPSLGAGRTGSFGDQDVYTFHAIASQRVFFDVLQIDGACGAPTYDLTWQLTRSNGDNLGSGPLYTCSGGDAVVDVAEDGVYTLSIATDFDSANTHTYSFSLSALPRDSFATEVGATVAPDQPAAGAGRIETRYAQDVYTFTGTARQRLLFDVLEVNGACGNLPFGDLNWTLRRPNGDPVSGGPLRSCTEDDKLIELVEAGTYVLSVTTNTTPGITYGFTLTPLPAQTFPIQVGDTVGPDSPAPGAGRIEAPYAQDIYTFNATAGQRLLFDVLEVNGGCSGTGGSLGWRIRTPSGNNLFGAFGSMVSCDDDQLIDPLPEDGTYSLVVDAGGNGPAIGSYKFKLSAVEPPRTFPIALGEAVRPGSPEPGAGTLESPGARDVYSFTTTTDHIFFDALEIDGRCDGPPKWLVWLLENGTGYQDSGILSQCSDDKTIDLPSAGSYTITVQAQNSDLTIGTYGFRLSAIPPAEHFSIGIGDTVGPGSPLPGAGWIESPGAEDVYTFSALAGERFLMDPLEAGGGCGDVFALEYELTNEADVRYDRGAVACDVGRFPVTLDAGVYTLVIRAGRDDAFTGTYRFRALSLPTAAFSYTPNSPKMGEAVKFDASASSTPRGSIVKYEWDFDADHRYETVSSTPIIDHSFAMWGGHQVGLRVTNDGGASSETVDSISVQYVPPPPVEPSVVPSPGPQKTATLAPVTGIVLLKKPGAGNFVRVRDKRRIPVGSIVDTRKGKAQLTSAADVKGRTRSAAFRAGVFKLREDRPTATDLQLVGGHFEGCRSGDARKGATAVSARRRRRTVRRLSGEGQGDFRTDGRYSSTSVIGTSWAIEDRCDGTLTRVFKGIVSVRDFVRHRTIVVKAGNTYLARPR
jgi:hypothetical protein